jgi:ribosomal protein S18 acetylase RimI-like enzyme
VDGYRVAPASGSEDLAWLDLRWRESWGDVVMVSRGRVHRLNEQSALIAWSGSERVGLATYAIDGESAELTSIEANEHGRGIGSLLLSAVEESFRRSGCDRLWLITTNDNLDALRFYQRRGFRMVAVHEGAVDKARSIKPSIPKIGNHGIAIHDEIELEKLFDHD